MKHLSYRERALLGDEYDEKNDCNEYDEYNGNFTLG